MKNIIKTKNSNLVLTILLLALLIVYPLMSLHLTWEALIDLFVLAILIYGVWSTSRQKQYFIPILIFAITFVFSDWISVLTNSSILQIASALAGSLFFGFLGFVLLRNIFQQGTQVTVDMIYSSISVYLMIGLAFAFLYLAFNLIDPNAFSETKFMESGFQAQLYGFIYFSFVTLSTLGFGDVSPNTSQIAAFVYIEAIIGQLYLTILVARLVGLHISQGELKQTKKEAK